MTTNLKKFIWVFPLLLSCQHSSLREPAEEKLGKKEIKLHFRNLSEEERRTAIAKARITVTGFDASKISQVDVIADLQKRCGPLFKYQATQTQVRSESGSDFRTVQIFEWPKVQCTYQQDDGGLSGMSSKFLCAFPDPEGKKPDVRKVKYAANPNQPLSSEVFETVLATNIANLLGFYADTFCPAQIVCQNCPSGNPWKDNRASVPPGTSSQNFQWAIVENPVKGFTMTNPGEGDKPQGLQWDELKTVSASSREEEKQMRVEREAWMLWINFLRHWDADAHNQRLSCLDADTVNGSPTCRNSIAYTHDYGLSFPRMNLSFWSKEALRSEGNRCQGTLEKALIGGNPGEGAILHPFISSEARDLLLSRLKQVTDKQWLSFLQLARVGEVTPTESSEWLRAIHKKIEKLEKVSCESMDSGSSVLAR